MARVSRNDPPKTVGRPVVSDSALLWSSCLVSLCLLGRWISVGSVVMVDASDGKWPSLGY